MNQSVLKVVNDMKKFVFSTPQMSSGVVVEVVNLKAAKIKIRQYLCVTRLPKNTKINEYLF